MGTRLIKAAEQSITTIVRLFRWWFRLIGQQSTPRARAVVFCVGLLALCTVCSVPVAMVNGPKNPAPAIAIAPSTQPASAEGDPPTTRPTEAPSTTHIPSSTTAPATATPEPPDTLTTEPTATPPLNRAPHQHPQLSRR